MCERHWGPEPGRCGYVTQPTEPGTWYLPSLHFLRLRADLITIHLADIARRVPARRRPWLRIRVRATLRRADIHLRATNHCKPPAADALVTTVTCEKKDGLHRPATCRSRFAVTNGDRVIVAWVITIPPVGLVRIRRFCFVVCVCVYGGDD